MKALLVLIVSVTLTVMAENPAELQVVKGNGQFTSNLYKILSENDNDNNIFFSPISVHAVLAMAFQGAKGSTAEKFASTLKLTDAASAAEGYNAVMGRLNSVPNVTLLMANKVYLKEGHKMLQGFSDAVTKKFLSEVQLVDFGKNVEAAATINKWVEEQTNSKIKDLIKEDDLNALTRLVLVNAIYFKGNWKHQFKKELTKEEPFYLNENDKVNVQMMHLKENFLYKNDEGLDAQLLELPYTNEDLTMLIILPNKKNGLADLEKKLQTISLDDLTKNMYSTKVNVALPKFKIEQTIDLKDALTKVGLGEIFDEVKANFTNMIELNPNENLYVSKVIQKAFIEVNEEGAEAAAATAVVGFATFAALRPAPEIVFKVDHGFIFILRKKEQQINNGRDWLPLFMGAVKQF